MGLIEISSAPFAILVIKPCIIDRGKGHKVLGVVAEKGFLFGNRIIIHQQIDIEQAKLFYPFNEEWGKKVGAKLKLAYSKLSLSCADMFNTEDEIKLGKIIISWVWEYITSGPITAIPVFNKNKNEKVIEELKEIVGETDPSNAKPGTLRRIFCEGESLLQANKDRRAIRNGIHCSTSIPDAIREAEALGFISH